MMFGGNSHTINPVDGLFPENVPSNGCPQFCSSLAQSWTFARSAATNITGILLVYMKLRGHLIPCPLTLPKDSGISTFIACAYTAKQNTTIVAITAAMSIPASRTFPDAMLWKNAGIAPVAIVGFAGLGNGDSILMNSCFDTPAAMNSDIPDPNPHLLTTSSMNMM